ncbi:hypothetical protein [Halalkalicoccus salilacus]|uniref:hypothetical protein n=1 Tax=Halalkalicoccus sp. GCM10025704 TaxID=3252662 RepID=UPI0036223276
MRLKSLVRSKRSTPTFAFAETRGTEVHVVAYGEYKDGPNGTAADEPRSTWNAAEKLLCDNTYHDI